MKILALAMATTLLVFTVPAESYSTESKIPLGYTKWKDGSEFAYRWITKSPKDAYYRGIWQGIASVISVVYVNGFSCSPELPDGSTNSVEVEVDIFQSGRKVFSGRGNADTIRNKGPFRIEISFYGAPKGYGSSVRQVKLKSVDCRM